MKLFSLTIGMLMSGLLAGNVTLAGCFEVCEDPMRVANGKTIRNELYISNRGDNAVACGPNSLVTFGAGVLVPAHMSFPFGMHHVELFCVTGSGCYDGEMGRQKQGRAV